MLLSVLKKLKDLHNRLFYDWESLAVQWWDVMDKEPGSWDEAQAEAWYVYHRFLPFTRWYVKAKRAITLRRSARIGFFTFDEGRIPARYTYARPESQGGGSK